ncbi:MAG: hypothetical protein ACE5KL_07225 [Alphaproteobacteria bacterium]
MIAQTATKVRGILSDFSGILSVGLSKPARRFVAEALYGIVARQSVRLTEIGRALEESIALAKTETRLSRNLGRPELRQHLEAAVLKQGSRRIDKRTLLILDISDITKPYAKKMECLARVRDASTGEIANGYWLCQVIGVENEGNEITPLYGALYSQRAAEFVSENEEIKTAIAKVSAACDGHGIWVIDRGGDRGELYSPLLAAERSFIIRQKGDRHILFDRRNVETAALAAECPMLYATYIVREDKGQEVSYRLDYGFRPVRLPEHPDVRLWLVVVRGLGRQPMMLLTNLPIRRKRSVLWWVVCAYLTRWRIEETIRFTKQSYDLEDIRVMTYDRLRNMVALVNAAAFFTAVVLGTKVKLQILASHLLRAAKRLFGIPDFRYYALADGIAEVCARSPRRSPTSAADPPQLSLALP